MATYWVHVSPPRRLARLHLAGGCKWVRWAQAQVRADAPPGSGPETTGGYWAGPFPTLASARARQRASGETVQDTCRAERCGAHFSTPR